MERFWRYVPQITTVGLVGGFRDDGGIGTQEEPAVFRRKTRVLRVLCDSGLRNPDPLPDIDWSGVELVWASFPSRASFPLTPALSPRERENPAPRYAKSRHSAIPSAGRRGTLSFGERDGVRGNWTQAISTGSGVLGLVKRKGRSLPHHSPRHTTRRALTLRKWVKPEVGSRSFFRRGVRRSSAVILI